MRAIVGFDPGITCGVAVVSLEGTVLYLGSFRGEGVDKIVGKVIEVAKPIIVATDVSPTPDSVHKFARSFGAVIFTPTLSLTVAEKQDTTSGIKLGDLHQRDSLAAALAAYRAYRPIIEKAMQRSGPNYEEAVERIVLGASGKFHTSKQSESPPQHVPRSKDFMRSYQTLKQNRDLLQRELSFSRSEIQSLKDTVRKLQYQLEAAKSSHFGEVLSSQTIRDLQSKKAAMESNQKVLLQRTQKAENALSSIERWMESKVGDILLVEKQGPGFRIGGARIKDEPKSKLEKIIREHRARKLP